MTPGASLVAARDWLKVLDGDYLQTFIRAGGSSVRLAVGSHEVREFVRRSLTESATSMGYVTASVQSDDCRVHLVHELVREINCQIPWREAAENVIRTALLDDEFGSRAVSINAIAEQQGVAAALVRRRLERYLTADVYRDKSLSRDFRVAMMQMLAGVADADASSQILVEALELWLKGDLPRIGALKETYIHQQINRQSARGVFGSLGPWLTKAGYSGLVVVIDIGRYAETIMPNVGVIRYTPARALDMYEVVREFIDTTDDLQSTLMVFLTGPDFVLDDRRGLRAYNALYMRLAEDVRGRSVASPLAPMVRLDDGSAVA